MSASDHVLWVKALDNVSGRLFAVTPRARGGWPAAPVPLPANSTVHLLRTAGKQDIAFATVENMLTPPGLYAVSPGIRPALVQSLPPRFDARLYTVERRFARSKDGSRVPYFLARRKGAKGPLPTLIHAYGGFRSAQTP